MSWTNPGCELRAIIHMNDLGSWVEGSRCHEQLKVLDDMNDFESWAEASKYYE